MEQEKLEKIMALSFIFIGVAFLLQLLSYAVYPRLIDFFPFFLVPAVILAFIAGIALYKDSGE